MPVLQCHCATLTLCHRAIVPHCPYVTVPQWNKRGGGQILNVYDVSGHLVLHSKTLPPAFQCLQLYVKCHIQRQEERQWFEVTDLQVFESSEHFARCNLSLSSRRRHSVLYGTCSCVQGCTNPSILVAKCFERNHCGVCPRTYINVCQFIKKIQQDTTMYQNFYYSLFI